MSEHCEATYRENLRQRLVRLADDDLAWQDDWRTFRCARERGHGGDHHGPIDDPQHRHADMIAAWPVERGGTG